MLQSASLRSMSAESAASRTRLSLARDLHDSVVQLLAGTSLRLEGIRKSMGAGRAIDAELGLLQDQLGTEQRELRRLIGGLRDGAAAHRHSRLSDCVDRTLKRAAAQWRVDCALAQCPDGLIVTPEIEHEVEQLLREAVANAVRHGSASQISVSLDHTDGDLSIAIQDNGRGFAIGLGEKSGSQTPPWSLNERVHELGGTLMFASAGTGSQVTILLPWEQSE